MKENKKKLRKRKKVVDIIWGVSYYIIRNCENAIVKGKVEGMKYYVETWDTEEMIECFDTEDEREKYLNEMTIEINGQEGRYLRYDTSIRVAIYDC